MANQRLSQGFLGEKIMEVPKALIKKCQQNTLISNLYISRMGFYPKAANHYFQRPNGFSQAVLIYCTDGKGWITYESQKIYLKANELFLIPAGVPHTYGSDQDKPWSIYWIHIAGKNCNDMVDSVLDLGIKKPLKAVYSEERIQLFHKIFDCVFNGFVITNLLFANLSLPYFLASFISPENFSNTLQNREDESPTEKAKLYIENNFNRDVTVEEIANDVGLSLSFFSRKFKHDMGYSPIEYLNHLRIQKACQLLHFTNTRVKEIAFIVGFKDQFYFSRFFRKQIGISPSQFRKKDKI